VRPAIALAIALAIVLLHVLLAGLLLMRAPPRTREPARQDRWTTVRLIAPAPVPAAVDAPRPPATRPKGERTPRTAPLRPAPITLPAPLPPAAQGHSGAPVDVAAPPVAAASAPPAPPIVIPSQGLARGTSRHPALDDPRANHAAESPGERFARTLGTDDRLVEEWRGEGRHRVRQGTSCVDVKVARDAQLDPYNQNYRPAPRLVERCP
jgi:hypothetical protein